jgi:hypothetical protein
VNGTDSLDDGASIKQGTVTASLLRKLSAYPRQNGLALALRELGRIERTIVTLKWLQEPALRQRVSAGLKKGEERNAWPAPSSFSALARSAIGRSKTSAIVPAASIWSRPPSYSGTPCISKGLSPPSAGCVNTGGKATNGSPKADSGPYAVHFLQRDRLRGYRSGCQDGPSQHECASNPYLEVLDALGVRSAAADGSVLDKIRVRIVA